MSDVIPRRILRLPEVERRVGLKQTQIYRLEIKGRFPRRFKISDRASGWDSRAIDEWVEQKISAGASSPATA